MLAGDVAGGFLAAVPADPQIRRPLSDRHVSIDGTPTEAWASMKSLQPRSLPSGYDPRNGSGEPPADGRNGERDPCRWPVGRHPGVRELPCSGGYRVLDKVLPDTASNQTAGDVRVPRIYGRGQNRRAFDPAPAAGR